MPQIFFPQRISDMGHIRRFLERISHMHVMCGERFTLEERALMVVGLGAQ
jgi:hypothetical protein